jgi:hypothetical protein
VDALLLQRSQAVDAQASGDRDQERRYRLDAGPVGLVPAQVGILQKVLGFGARAEHAVGDPEQTGSVRFEECGGGSHGRFRRVMFSVAAAISLRRNDEVFRPWYGSLPIP